MPQERSPTSRNEAGSLRRHATFLFRSLEADALVEAIRGFGAVPCPHDAPASSHYWVYPNASARILEFHPIVDIADYEIDLSLEAMLTWWEPLRSALAGDPSVALTVYAGEGPAAADALRTFALRVLADNPGVVQDDNSDHAWVIDEIRAHRTRNGVEFFGSSRA